MINEILQWLGLGLLLFGYLHNRGKHNLLVERLAKPARAILARYKGER